MSDTSLWNILIPVYRSVKRYGWQTKRYIYYCILNKDMPLPKFIQLEPTTKCNNECITCSRKTLSSHRLNKDLTLKEFKKISSQIPSLREIKLQGLGEPLLCQNIEDILAYSASKKINCTTTSNGTEISDKNIYLILKYFKQIVISFDSAIKENFEKIRKGINYDKVLENIGKLVRRKKEIGSKTIINMAFVVTHLNFKELSLFFKLAEKTGVDKIEVVGVENWLIPGQKGCDREREFVKQAREIEEEIKKAIENYNGRFKIPHISTTKRKQECGWPFYHAFITVDGFVTPCCIRMDPEVINFGNIFETPFEDIWNSKEYKKFRKTMVKNLPNPICDYCPD